MGTDHRQGTVGKETGREKTGMKKGTNGKEGPMTRRMERRKRSHTRMKNVSNKGGFFLYKLLSVFYT